MNEWVLVCEGPTDHRAASALADRVVEEQVQWAEGVLDSLRRWRGIEAGTTCTQWRSLKKMEARGLRHLHGEYSRKGSPGHKKEFMQALKAIKLAERLEPRPAALVLIRDTDRRDRRVAHEAAREEAKGLRVVIGLPHATLEAWQLNGFIPQDDTEEEHVTAARTERGFGVTRDAHRLTPSDAKAVLGTLCSANEDRKACCHLDTPLDHLRERGADTGLTDYLDDVATHLTEAL